MSSNDLEKTAESEQKKTSIFSYLLLVIIAILLIAGAYWLTKQFLIKGEVEIPLPKEVAQVVNEGLRLDDGKIGPVRITPSEAEEAAAGAQQSAATAGQAGGALGQTPGVAANDGTEEERPSASGIIVEQGKSAVDMVPEAEAPDPGSTRKKVYEGSDAVVTTTFASDLAAYLAANYWPRGTHLAAEHSEVSSASIGAAGQRYGIELIGFASSRSGQRDYLRDRALVLNYAYMPTMVEALTRLYADRFVDELADHGFEQERNGKYMSREQVRDMLRYYARYARAVGAALTAYRTTPGADEVVVRYNEAQERIFLSDMRFQEANYRVESAREMRDADELRSAQQEMKSAEQEYRKTMLEQEQAKENVLAFMGKGDARLLDDIELLYIAGWAARRGANAAPAHQAASNSAEYLAVVLDEKAAELED